MNIRLRTPTAQDWPAIGRAADASLPWRADDNGNAEWLRNRISFDDRAHPRRHYVAEDQDAPEGVDAARGYGSVEGGPATGRFRLFVVCDAALLPSVGEALFTRLHADLIALGATAAFVREEARDTALLAFFRAHGFADEQQLTTDRGLRIVTLERAL